jgi:hypothetical protein
VSKTEQSRKLELILLLAFSLCPDKAEQAAQNERKKLNGQSNSTPKDSKSDPMCKHHSLKDLKSFELKSDCNKFHWKSEA